MISLLAVAGLSAGYGRATSRWRTLLKYMGAYCTDMDGSITESDMKRIAEFVSTPKYARDPGMLVPEDSS